MKEYIPLLFVVVLASLIILSTLNCNGKSPQEEVQESRSDSGGVTCESYAHDFTSNHRLRNIQFQLMVAVEAYYDGQVVPADVRYCLVDRGTHATLDSFVRVICSNKNVLTERTGNDRFQQIFTRGLDVVLRQCRVIKP